MVASVNVHTGIRKCMWFIIFIAMSKLMDWYVAGSHVYCKSGCISEMVQDKDVVAKARITGERGNSPTAVVSLYILQWAALRRLGIVPTTFFLIRRLVVTTQPVIGSDTGPAE